jgi:hypothetical protein
MVMLKLLINLVPEKFGTKEMRTIFITVKVSKKITGSLQKRKSLTSKFSDELLTVEKDLGISLEPLHPGAEDPHLSLYFKVKVPDHATATKVINRLLNCKAVEAAYIKPSDELPTTTGGTTSDKEGELP